MRSVSSDHRAAGAQAGATAAGDLLVDPRPGASFGVQVRNASVQRVARDLRGLLAQHRVVVLQGLRLDADGLVALARGLGPVRQARVRHPSLPGAAGAHIFVSAREASAIPPGPTPADAAHLWHVDYGQASPVPRWSMLYALRMPPSGSRNGFVDMARVHAALPQALKDEIAGLQACHYAHPDGVDVMPADQQRHVDWTLRERGTAHPLVMHDDAGRPCLFLPARRDSPVVGLDEAASRALLDRLWPHVEAQGRPWDDLLADGELLIWDNHALLHRRSEWPRHEERLLWFLTVD